MRSHCPGANPHLRIYGCAQLKWSPHKQCTIWIVPDEVLKEFVDYDTAFCHERGHCNGWTHEAGWPNKVWATMSDYYSNYQPYVPQYSAARPRCSRSSCRGECSRSVRLCGRCLVSNHSSRRNSNRPARKGGGARPP